MGNSRKLCLLCSERSEMPGLEVDVLQGALASTLSKKLTGTKLPVAWSLPPQHCHYHADAHGLQNCQLYQQLSWAVQAGEVGDESKTRLTMPLAVVICLPDVGLTSQTPNRLTSRLQTHGTAPHWTPNGSVSRLLLWWPHTTHLLIRQVPLGHSGEPKILTQLSKEMFAKKRGL